MSWAYLARQLHAAAIEAYDLSDVRRLVDVGGGHGHLVSTIVRRYPGDVEAAAILGNVRAAMDPGRILVIDTVIPHGDIAHFGKLMDIVMLACFTGREQTEAEFAALFESAGLRHCETRTTSSPTSVIVAAPASD